MSASAQREPATGPVLVTGGGGFIGANLVRQLLSAGRQVTVYDNFSVGRTEYLAGLDLEVVHGDILDRVTLAEAVGAHDRVVHLAAQTGVPGSLEDPRRDCEMNVIGTLNVLESVRAAEARRPRGRRVVFASSNAPLGRQTPPATEDKAPLPISPYGASKLAGEAYCLAYHGSWGLGTIVLRFANIYGPFSAHKGSVVAKFFKDIVERGRIGIDGDGEQTRDFIYVGDLCAAILRALDSDLGGEVFQIATGRETSIVELADAVRTVTGHDFDVEHEPARPADIRKNYSHITKADRLLGWRPHVQLEEGLRETWNWFGEASKPSGQGVAEARTGIAAKGS